MHDFITANFVLIETGFYVFGGLATYILGAILTQRSAA